MTSGYDGSDSEYFTANESDTDDDEAELMLYGFYLYTTDDGTQWYLPGNPRIRVENRTGENTKYNCAYSQIQKDSRSQQLRRVTVFKFQHR